MSSDIAIKVEQLSKCYQLYDKPRDRLKQMLMRGHKQYYREFWALKNISFEVKKGETVGIIGRNGSGKSTLLQMICGTLTSTSGNIQTYGRIGALLELGSGFNPEFTGRENVFMNAALLGLSREEVDARYDDIVSFADIGEFIEQHVKTYSSGMVVRLAFAVQALVEPDILIVDEALAVGDAKFQAKCFKRLKQLRSAGTSILLVTHSTEQIVTHCNRAILLNAGAMVAQGKPRQVANRYMEILFGKEKIISDSNAIGLNSPPVPSGTQNVLDPERYLLSVTEDIFSSRPGYNPYEFRWGDGAARILDFHIAVDGIAYPPTYRVGQEITLVLTVAFLSEVVRPILGITIKTREGMTVFGVNSETLDFVDFQSLGQAGTVVRIGARFTCRLASGDYFISLGIASRQAEEIVPHDRRYDSIHVQVSPEFRFFGIVDLDLHLSACEEYL